MDEELNRAIIDALNVLICCVTSNNYLALYEARERNDEVMIANLEDQLNRSERVYRRLQKGG